ncbi:metal-sulfur cluster assembly factor [Consotaella aegiceratis]|uniref:metal-sulfur cluster assembly factor n=1 Tax=Consotaella aegiceratis TaxID=3097961 RepID=UPI002F3FFA60
MPAIEQEVREALRSVDDPELGVNIVDLGLVRSLAIRDRDVAIVLMMTTPTCPLGALIAETAKAAVEQRLGLDWTVAVTLDRETIWQPNLAAPEIRARFAQPLPALGTAVKAGLARLFARS